MSLAFLLALILMTACSSLSPPPTPTPSPQVARGRSLFATNCARCHSTGSDIVVGPSLAGLASRAASRIPGLDAPAYIRDSITNPTAYIVDGFPDNLMPLDFAQQLPPEDLDAVVAFLLTLE